MTNFQQAKNYAGQVKIIYYLSGMIIKLVLKIMLVPDFTTKAFRPFSVQDHNIEIQYNYVTIQSQRKEANCNFTIK